MNPLSMIALLIGLTSVLSSSLAQAGSFLIELKNGRDVITRHVWEEGDEIKFYTADGTAGVPKTQVKRIKASTTGSHDKGSKPALPPSPADREVSTPDPRSEKHPHTGGDMRRETGKDHSSPDQPQDGGSRLKAGDAEAYRAKKVMLTAKLDDATNMYLAASGARNPDAKQAALDEMREHSKHILDLEDELKKKNGGVLPPWWNE